MTVNDFVYLEDNRRQRPIKPIGPGDGGDDEGPKRPTVPDRSEIIRRMRRVDKDQSRRYRQRTGE
jgi:hypothetical protein